MDNENEDGINDALFNNAFPCFNFHELGESIND